MKDYLTNKVGSDETDDPLHYASSLIEKIKACGNQEIAAHTFSHFYMIRPVNDEKAFEKELDGMATVCPDAVSMVFPRNQSVCSAIAALKKYGYAAYRGVQENWLCKHVFCLIPLQKEGWFLDNVRRLLRLVEVYLPIYGSFAYPIESVIEEDGICNIRASSMFKPYVARAAFLEWLKIRKIKSGMKKAAKKGLVYHLWWHPHNTGIRYDINFKHLDEIFTYYNSLAEKYGMASLNMKELAEKALTLQKKSI